MHNTNIFFIFFLIFKEFVCEGNENVTNDPFIFEHDLKAKNVAAIGNPEKIQKFVKKNTPKIIPKS